MITLSNITRDILRAEKTRSRINIEKDRTSSGAQKHAYEQGKKFIINIDIIYILKY